MSRSSNLVTNPATRTLKFKNEKFNKKTKQIEQEAGFYFYNKEGNDGEGENVLVPMPIRFLWLESAQSVTGFNPDKEVSVWSNEILTSPDSVKKYGKKDLVVKVGNETELTGQWADIKADVKDLGGKFCIPVYASVKNEDGEYEVQRFLFSGGSRSAWMDLSKDRAKLLSHAIEAYDIQEVEMKTGDSYQAPKLRFVEATAEEVEAAENLVKSVDAYFEYMFSGDEVKHEAVETDADY